MSISQYAYRGKPKKHFMRNAVIIFKYNPDLFEAVRNKGTYQKNSFFILKLSKMWDGSKKEGKFFI